MGINFGAALKGFADTIKEEAKEDKKFNRILVSNTLDKYTTNYYDKKKTHEKEDKIIESTANFVLQHVKDPILAVQIANQGKAGLDEFKKNLALATERGVNINDLYSAVYEPSEELKSMTSVNEIIKATRPFEAPAIPTIGGKQTLFTSNPNDTIKDALKDVVGTDTANKVSLSLGQTKVKGLPEIKSNFNSAILAINSRISGFLDNNGGDSALLKGDVKTQYDDMIKEKDGIIDTYKELEKIKADLKAPVSAYAKVNPLKLYQSFVASSIGNSNLYKISLGEVVDNIKNNTRNKYIVGAHSAIISTAKTYSDAEMAKVLDVQHSLLQTQAKEHMIKARAAQSGTTTPKHYTIVDASEGDLKNGVYLDTSTRKRIPIRPGTVVKVNTASGDKYVLYTGQGTTGYLTGNSKQPRIEPAQ